MASDSNVPPGRQQFDHILRTEVDAINERRRSLGREELALEPDRGGHKVMDAVGLALSGGGVRSAAFSLGVLQALNHHDVVRNVDYISTVSGGGYMGSSLTSSMTSTEGQFVFGKASASGARPAGSEISDTAAVGHLRNYSNYLIPAGTRDLLTGVAIMLRGLVANLGWVLAVVLLVAAATILTNPNRKDLECPDLLGLQFCGLVENFGLTLVFAMFGLALFFLWALYRSAIGPDRAAEFRTRLPMIASAYLIVVAAVFFLELQTFFLRGMFDLKDAMDAKDSKSLEWLTATLTTLAAVVTPLAAVVTVFRQQLGDILKAANAGARASTRAAAALGKVSFWVAGAAIPLLVWVAYLYLSYWGIINSKLTPMQAAAANAEFSAPAELAGMSTVGLSVEEKNDPEYCIKRWGPREMRYTNADGAHTPRWMIHSASWLTYAAYCPLFKPIAAAAATDTLFVRILDRPMVLFYTIIGVAFLILACFLKANANSLHRLYRDRLSKAFLFDPREGDQKAAVKRNEPSVDQGRDFAQLDRLLISKLSTQHAPYHLINAALNVQGSDYGNRRGRNADFFLFSPCYVGSEATGYAPTALFEKCEKGLDLATAMAISGAAASSNMGSASIKPLRPTLALLNIRLGYWLKNPRYTAWEGRAVSNGSLRTKMNNMRRAMTPFLWSEITGRLYENSTDVYLTDGGHIENLGVYELLRRRCKLIVVVDAEADFAMHFPSFVTLQRYARIDLGAVIDMPWSRIQKATCAWMGSAPPSGRELSQGPHAAIGTIDYGGGERGYLLYIKSSLTGDENDYIRDYARRYQLFPHETTGDQFFSEEQFEVYRALGFHAAHGVLAERDGLEVFGEQGLATLGNTENELVREVREAIRGSVRAAERKAA